MADILDLPEVRARLHRWTVAEYIAVAEENPDFSRSQLIRGLIIDRPPKPPLLSFLSAKFYDYFLRQIRGELSVRQYAPLQLHDSMPEPEITVVPGDRHDYRSCHPTRAELVVEIAVGSAALDHENASLYAEAGVAEYWIVLAEAEEIEVYRRPENGVYQEKRTCRRGEAIPCACVEGGMVPVATWFA